MLQFDCRKQRQHTRNYKVSTPYCRKIIINHDDVKQVTENIFRTKFNKNYLYLVFYSIKILSHQERSSSKQPFIPSHVIILIILITRDNIQSCLLVVHIHRLFMLQSISQRPLIRL